MECPKLNHSNSLSFFFQNNQNHDVLQNYFPKTPIEQDVAPGVDCSALNGPSTQSDFITSFIT